VTTGTQTPDPVRVRSLIPLAAVSVSVGLATALALPFMSLFLTGEVGADPVALGAFLLVMPIAGLVLSTLIGRLSDARAIRRTLLAAGAGAGACGYALFAVLRDYWLLLAVSSTLIAVASSVMPQMFAYARQSLERSGSTKAPLYITSLRTLISLSWVAGPPLAALLVSMTGYGGLFGATALFYAAVAVLTIRLPELTPEKRATTEPERARRGPRAEIVFAVLAFVLIQGAAILGTTMLPLFVTDELHGTTGDTGLILGLCAALEIPLMIGFGVLAVKTNLRRLVLCGAVVALGYHGVMLATTSTWHVAAAQVLNAVVISAVMGIGISYFQTLAPDRPGYATTLFTNTTTAGAMVAGPLLGVALQFGHRSAYLICLMMCALGLVLLALARTRPS
jgi:SET family sugar efflux transporter-like MFS transporter